jgi:hypothetical protein
MVRSYENDSSRIKNVSQGVVQGLDVDPIVWVSFIFSPRKQVLKSKALNFVADKRIAFVYFGLKDTNKFLEYLEIAVKEKTMGGYLLRYQPQFDDDRGIHGFRKYSGKQS